MFFLGSERELAKRKNLGCQECIAMGKILGGVCFWPPVFVATVYTANDCGILLRVVPRVRFECWGIRGMSTSKRRCSCAGIGGCIYREIGLYGLGAVLDLIGEGFRLGGNLKLPYRTITVSVRLAEPREFSCFSRVKNSLRE